MEKYYYGYDEFIVDVNNLTQKLQYEKFEAIVAIARGGLTLTHLFASKLGLRDVFSINSISYDNDTKIEKSTIFNIPDLTNYKKVLVVDDIVDSGETLSLVLKVLKDKFPNLEPKTASLFYKPTAIISPDFTQKEATAWIEFFWEVD